MSGYVKTFTVENKINKLISVGIDNEKLLEKYKGIWTKIENLKTIELDALPVYDNKYLKSKIRTSDDKVYTNFRDLNVSEDDINVNISKSFLLILYLYTTRKIISKYF